MAVSKRDMRNNKRRRLRGLYRYPYEKERRLRQHILSGDRERAVADFDELFATFARRGETLLRLKSYVLQLHVVLVRKCLQAGVNVDVLLDQTMVYAEKLSQAQAPSELRALTLELIDRLIQIVRSEKGMSHQKVIDLARKYIEANYHRNVSLDEVSEVANLSYYYFSRLFAQETGRTFREYLTSVRLLAAKELLLNSNLSIEEIAAQVGYEDASHFVRVFKQREGVTPRQFSHNVE